MENKQNTAFKSVSEVEKALLNNLKGFNMETYDLNKITEKIKNRFLRENIKKYNVLNMKRHILSDQDNFYKNKEVCYKRLLYNSVFNFVEIENTIKAEMGKYTAKDRIKESQKFLEWEKVFKFENKVYSLHDLKKLVTEETIKEKIGSLNKFCLSCYGLDDNYYIKESLNDLKDFLKLLLDVEINFKWEHQKPIKEIEAELNQNKEVKINLFKKFIYVSFKDEIKQEKFKTFLIDQTLKRLGGL